MIKWKGYDAQVNIKAILICVLVIILVLVICYIVFTLSFYHLLDAISKPIEVDWTPNRQQDVYKHIGVKVPESAQYVEGREYSGRDLSYVFIFKFSCDSFWESQQDADTFLREQLQMDEANFSRTYEVGPYEYDTLSSFDCVFTHRIDPENPWSKICYCIEDDVLYVGLYYVIP